MTVTMLHQPGRYCQKYPRILITRPLKALKVFVIHIKDNIHRVYRRILNCNLTTVTLQTDFLTLQIDTDSATLTFIVNETREPTQTFNKSV